MYSRKVAGRTHTFGVSGALWRNALVMYDRETDSRWAHFTGECIAGKLRGKRLEVVAAAVPRITFGAWKSRHPETTVLTVDGRQDLTFDAYRDYHASERTGIVPLENENRRLDLKAMVVGVWIGDVARAYPYDLCDDPCVISDSVADVPIVAYRNPETGAIGVWRRRVGDAVLTFGEHARADRAKDRETGSTWDLLTGKAVSGGLEGKALTGVPHVPAYWFAWQDYHPRTSVHGR